jgi:hypothetical protein
VSAGARRPGAKPNVNKTLPIRPLWLAFGGLAVAAGAAVLYWFPPGSVWFYPRCMFHQMTGLNCPGCGGLRAAHQLLHGHWGAAFALNPLLTILAPVFAWMTLSPVWRAATGRGLPQPFKHPAWLWTLFGLIVVFGIVRNLPIAPFAALSP